MRVENGARCAHCFKELLTVEEAQELLFWVYSRNKGAAIPFPCTYCEGETMIEFVVTPAICKYYKKPHDEAALKESE